MAATVRSTRLKDVQATCIAYDAVSGNVILPGRRAFMFVPLTEFEPSAPTRYTLRQAALADATRIYCNPESPSLFAIARGQSLELYEFNRTSMQSNTEICSKKMEIQAHSKTIDDFSWCPTVSNWITTCSRDQYAILWDVSRQEAVVNFRATSPFSCCCWLHTGKMYSGNAGSEKQPSPLTSSQMSGYVVVTTADSRLLFWDVRAGSRPAIVVQAHAMRIHALDTGSAPSEVYQLATAADGDARMAIWDVRNLDRKLTSIDSPFGNQAPRRIRFSPSGGMLLVTASTMPRPALIDEPRAAVISPIETNATPLMLPGHMDHVYDAIWPSGDMVITWSQDFYLRQFQLTNRQLTTAASTTDSILVGLASGSNELPIGISRESTPSTPPMLRPGISHISQTTSEPSTATSIPSSVPPLLPLLSPQPTQSIPQPPPLPTQVPSTTNLTGSGTPAVQFAIAPYDYMIPSPRTAGARFCPAGFLVSLHRLYELKRNDRALADFHRAFAVHSVVPGRQRIHRNRHPSLSRHPVDTTSSAATYSDRSQSIGITSTFTSGVLSGTVSPSSGGASSTGHHHHHHQFVTQQSVTPSASSSALTLTAGSSIGDNTCQHTVLIYSVNALLKCNRELAIELKLDWTKPAQCCRENVEIAQAFDRPDLAQAFSVAALVLDDSTLLTKPDLVGCIGRDALIRMFSHYVKQGCMQDAALLAFFLSLTGIDLNNTPDDYGSNQLSESMIQADNRTPPLETQPNSLSVAAGVSENQPQTADGIGTVVLVNIPSPARDVTAGGGQSREVKIKMVSISPDYVEVSAVRRSSSWHDVQNASPGDSNGIPPEGSASASGEARSRHDSDRQLVFSPPKGAYNNRLLQLAAAKRRSQEAGRGSSGTPYSGCSESERIQMSVVLRCYATQLYAWRLHDRRTALLRPLNPVAAGQLSSVEAPTRNASMIEHRIFRIPHSTARGNTSGVSTGYYHQASIEAQNQTPVPTSMSIASIGSPSQSTGLSANCSVCDRPIRGLATICVACGHGGHAVHIRDFFSDHRNRSCPAGCGCFCPNI